MFYKTFTVTNTNKKIKEMNTKCINIEIELTFTTGWSS